MIIQVLTHLSVPDIFRSAQFVNSYFFEVCNSGILIGMLSKYYAGFDYSPVRTTTNKTEFVSSYRKGALDPRGYYRTLSAHFERILGPPLEDPKRYPVHFKRDDECEELQEVVCRERSPKNENEKDGEHFWHYITMGFIKPRVGCDCETDRCGYELSLRMKKCDEQELEWPKCLLVALSHVDSRGCQQLKSGMMERALKKQSGFSSLSFRSDGELGCIRTLFGWVEFLEVVFLYD